ncbi:MAG: beta-galactosidase [Mucilaginibacter sp.]|uniref:beta-galactosidase n=1 Tax=Mucilaginibacter sp. TaxID=1882438 RepID=UPI003267A98A
MTVKLIRRVILIVACIAISQSLRAQINDYIFPASPAAKKFMDFDAKGFLINGKRTFIVSAGMEYARIPHQLWYDRLLRLKRGGFNCIEIYTFWNFHEPNEGHFKFSGDQDLDTFLKTVKQLGMYAIVRVGPYYCGEWDSGGYPIWLRFKDNITVRSPNAEFEKYMDRFFDKLLPIVNNNQINKGGSVILVQLENEHPASWGTFIPNDYFKHLQQKALASGLEVPYFFSGLNHGSDPAGKKPTLDDPNRPNPWFTTEFWSVWYNLYGSTQKDADTYGRRTWKIIAHGGNGYNYYMAHGGTNFDYSFSHEDAASYDYGAAVGQTGDLRPIYYQFKRNALFARSFESVLENSTHSDAYQSMLKDTGVVLTTRHSDNGDILFFDHASAGNAALSLSPEGLPPTQLNLAPGEIFPVVHNYKLTGNITLNWGLSRILGVCEQGKTTTLVMYGPVGSSGDLQLTSKIKPVLAEGSKPISIKGNQLTIHTRFDAVQPLVYSFRSGGQLIRILALNSTLADRTWFIDAKSKNYVVTGPEYVSELKPLAKGQTELTTEHFWEQQNSYPTWLYGETFSRMTPAAKEVTNAGISKGKFSAVWLAKNASPGTADKFDDSSWKQSENPLEMGADDDISSNAWYRTHISVKTAGTYKLSISKGGGRFIVFIDDKRVADGMLDNLQFEVTSGDHLLTVYAAHDGRDKLYNFIGNLQNTDVKGIAGDVILRRGAVPYVTTWKTVAADNYKEGDALTIPSFDNATPYQAGGRANTNTLKRGYAWFQTEVPVIEGRVPLQFNFKGIAENAIVFINGKQVAKQEKKNKPLTVLSDGAQRVVITVFAENKGGQNNRGVFGAINKPVEIIFKDDQFLTNWRMKGGPGNIVGTDNWKALSSADQFDRPYFFKNSFIISHPKQSHPMWRVTFDGLSHGFVFVNGHNIGGYPERVPVKSLYIPECWLKEGENTIVIYDQYGNRPDKIEIVPETISSRNTKTLIL